MGFILSIAGVELRVDTGQLKLPTDALKHRLCRLFFSECGSNGSDRLNIRLTGDPAPDLTGSVKIFDSQSSWSIHADRQDLFIVDQYPPFTRPVWTARLQLNNRQVTVYCDDAIIDAHSGMLAFNPIAYPLDQILLMHYLATHEGGIFHAAGWAPGERGWVFAGKSGAGKSTLARLIDDPSGDQILSDDRIVVRRIGQTFAMFGTPWPGEGNFAVNRGARLERLMFLVRGTGNRITEITPSAAISKLMPVLSVPWYDEKLVAIMMDFCENLLRQVPAYEFSFLPDSSAKDFLKRRGR